MATLLVVDDEPDIRDLVVRRLVRDGYEVLSAESGPSALALVERYGAPDAAVLDIDMPDMDGFTLLEKLRQVRPDLPVLVLTVLWDAEVYHRIREANAVYVAKPFTATEFAAGVAELMRPAPGGAEVSGTDR